MAAPIKVDYFTDPYCAWSWALQSSLEELLQKEEDGITVTYRGMALIPNLAKSGKTAEDIAKAWEKIGRLTGVPIDASLWRKHPPQSTIPGLHAAKAAGTLGRGMEGKFLQALRPLLMRKGRSADQMDTLHEAAKEAGLDLHRFDEALEQDHGQKLAEDARLAVEMGITSTPALVLRNRKGDKIVIQGPRDLELLKRAVETLRLEEDLEEAAEGAPRVTSTPLMPETAKEAEQKT